MTEADDQDTENSNDSIFGELNSLLDEVKQKNSKGNDYLTPFQDALDELEELDTLVEEESDEEQERKWIETHSQHKQKAGEVINQLKKNLENLQRGVENRDLGSYFGEGPSEDALYELTAKLDGEFRSMIKGSKTLLSRIKEYFNMVSVNEEWETENATNWKLATTEIESISSLLHNNIFLEGRQYKLEFFSIGTTPDERPNMYVFMKSVLLHSILSVYGGINALIMYIMDENGIEEAKDLFGQELHVDTPSEGAMEFLKNSSALSSFDYQMSPKESEEINDILQNLTWSMREFSKTLDSLPIGEGKYLPKLSEINSHVVTNKYRPRETYQNLGMWPLERERQHYCLQELDLNNWLGIEQHSQVLNYKATLHRINYRDFIDFIQSLGYVYKKVTDYSGFRRTKPVLTMFDWGERACKFRPSATIYFYNPQCPISNTEMRIVVDSRIGNGTAYLEAHVGLEIFNIKDSFNEPEELATVERRLLIRDAAEQFLQRLWNDFETYQCSNGLLKNSKFDAYITELNTKGRTFEDMILSDTKKKLIEENVFAILSNSERLIERGVETNRGIMLAGPPGVGKSLTIDAISSRSTSTVIFTNYLMLMGNMEGIFELARRYAPTILILEDIDALGITAQRGAGGSGAGLSTLLNCMDGINSNNGVISVATSNHPESMDWALIARPGRFDVRIDYPYPDHEVLKGILELKLRSYPCETPLGLDDLVEKMPLGFTGSHIQEIVNQANYICMNNSTDDALKVKITQSALESAAERSLYNFKKFLAERPHIKLENPPSVREILNDKNEGLFFQ